MYRKMTGFLCDDFNSIIPLYHRLFGLIILAAVIRFHRKIHSFVMNANEFFIRHQKYVYSCEIIYGII